MALTDIVSGHVFSISVAVTVLVAASSLFTYLFGRPSLPSKTPALVSDSWPILGSMNFFTKRWDFVQASKIASKTGNFTFFAGNMPVVGLSGDQERKLFFEHRGLGFAEGYAALLAGGPKIKANNNPLAEDHGGDTAFSAYFNKRLVAMMKGSSLKKGLAQMLRDARQNLDTLAAEPSGITDPFDSIYRMVFQFTMRTVACNEIAEDPALLSQCLQYFEYIDGASTPLSIMFSWMPLPSKAKRIYGGTKLYMIFKQIVDSRNQTGHRDDDCLQFLMDQGDTITDMITFVLGALFAGQLNTGINAAWILCYLASEKQWLERVRAEVNAVADRHVPDKSVPLKDRLMELPIEVWDNEFPLIDACMKDSIRLQMPGTAFRQNLSGADIVLNKNGEILPKDAYAAFPVGDIHLNPEVYADPERWDPSRYFPERAEDKKRTYGFLGWGAARHPCLGMRFAQLEMTVITAFFIAYFNDFDLLDENCKPLARAPAINKNNHAAKKPDVKVQIRFQ